MNTVTQLRPADPRAQAVAAVAALIHASEAAVDAAAVQTAALIGGVVENRNALGMSSTVGVKGEAAIARALTGLADAKLALAEVHRQAGVIATAMNVQLVGPMDKPEDTPPIGDGPKGRLLVTAVGPLDKPGDTPPIGGGGGDGPG